MELSDREMSIVNSWFFRWYQKWLELPLFRGMGLNLSGKKVLEIGCGSGYGASLFCRMNPASYTGVDLMPAQIETAKSRGLTGCDFSVMDAGDLSAFPNQSMDVVLDCRILHHVPDWKQSLAECERVLAPGGSFFACEPHGNFTRWTDRAFGVGHPPEALFSSNEFAHALRERGLETWVKRRVTVFAVRASKPGSS